MFGYAAPDFNHHYKTDYRCQITTTTNYVIYLCRVRVSFVACRVPGSVPLYMADFLLVYIYTLRNGLRDRELRVRISVGVAELAHFYA